MASSLYDIITVGGGLGGAWLHCACLHNRRGAETDGYR